MLIRETKPPPSTVFVDSIAMRPDCARAGQQAGKDRLAGTGLSTGRHAAFRRHIDRGDSSSAPTCAFQPANSDSSFGLISRHRRVAATTVVASSGLNHCRET